MEQRREIKGKRFEIDGGGGGGGHANDSLIDCVGY